MLGVRNAKRVRLSKKLREDVKKTNSEKLSRLPVAAFAPQKTRDTFEVSGEQSKQREASPVAARVVLRLQRVSMREKPAVHLISEYVDFVLEMPCIEL